MQFFSRKQRPLAPVVGQKTKITLLSGAKHRYVNLDNAATTPPLLSVCQELRAVMDWYGGVHRGVGAKSYVSTDLYEKCRSIVLDFLHADPTQQTAIFVRNTTEALNKLAAAWNLPAGSIVIATEMEHHSNDLPWRKYALVRHARVTADGRLDLDHLADLLKQNQGKVKVVTVTGASNVTGHVNDLKTIAKLTHQAGATLVVDAAQLAPHRAITMCSGQEDERIDCLALSAHKLYAPFGSGALVVPKSLLRSTPSQPGGGTVRLVTKNQVQWADLPEREESGSPNVLGAVSLARAMQQLKRIGLDKIASHENPLTDRLLKGLSEMSHVTVYGIPNRKQQDRVGVVSFNVHNLPHGLVGAYLAYVHGIGVRTGCFCAQPYIFRLLGMSEAKALQSFERAKHGYPLPGLVRASLGLYNTESDIDYLLEALDELKSPAKQAEVQEEFTYDPRQQTYLPSRNPDIWHPLTQRLLRLLKE